VVFLTRLAFLLVAVSARSVSFSLRSVSPDLRQRNPHMEGLGFNRRLSDYCTSITSTPSTYVRRSVSFSLRSVSPDLRQQNLSKRRF
jgi:hypothetical protein